MSDCIFSIGDRVVVARNSERVPSNSFVGMTGKAIRYFAGDAIVKFDDGDEHFIYQFDLEKVDEI